MDIRDFIAAAKVIQDAGKWQTGTMPRTAFPLSKSGSKHYRLANRRWRVVRFSVGPARCRLMINYHPTLLQYQAILGVEAGDDTKVLVMLERHPTHKPWHVHVCCDDVSSIPAGIKRGPWYKGMEGASQRHLAACPTTDESAFAKAIAFFKLDKTDDGRLV